MTAGVLVGADAFVLAHPVAQPVRGGVDVARELWRELGTTMRWVRLAQGYSLRTVEALTGWGRGSLSQAENGKAHPSRAMVEWYEEQFHSDGMLMSLYSEARVAHPLSGVRIVEIDECFVAGDAHVVERAAVPNGLLVHAGEQFDGGWTLRNSGEVQWRGRDLRRIGAYVGPRLISSPRTLPVPDAEPGQTVTIDVPLTAPSTPCTAIAYWRMTDATGRYCMPLAEALSVLLVVTA